jgi:hypothetical protein
MPVQAAGMALPAAITPDPWLRQLFRAEATRNCGVVGRKVREMDRVAGRVASEQKLCRR